MSKIVVPSLIIDGSAFLPESGYSVAIEQSMGAHSSFRVVFQTNATEGYTGALMDSSLKFAGKKISIGLDGGKMQFVGMVTSVDLQKGSGASGTLALCGQGPSILLSRSVQCLSHEEGTPFGQMVADTLKGHATDVLKTAVGRGIDIKLPYTVQYNESDFAFLRRMCARYGVWMYDNGTGFCVGRTGDRQLHGIYGQDVRTFNLSASLQGRPSRFNAYDWTNNSALEADSAAFGPTGAHPYLDSVKKRSDSVFAKKGNYNWPHGQIEYSGQQGLDTAAKVDTLGRAANMVLASGSSVLVSLRVGDSLSIDGLNFSDPAKKDPFGTYMSQGSFIVSTIAETT